MNNSTTRYKLTESQLSLWFEWKLNPHSTAYNLPYVFELVGPLEIPSLENSLQIIVNRHYALRTHFEEIGDEVFQVIDSVTDSELEHIDISHLKPSERKTALNQLIEQKCNYLFDLTVPPLFQFTLIQSEENIHYLILNFHHIIVDGTSAAIFIKKLSEYYNAIINNQKITFPEIDVDIIKILDNEEKYLKSDEYQKDIEVWRNLLKDAHFNVHLPPKLPLKNDRELSSVYFNFSKQQTKLLKDLVTKEEVTLFIALMACFKIFLYRYTGQEDLTFIYPTNTRSKQSRFTIGYFVNMLYSRTQLNDQLTFKDVIKLVIQERKTVYSHRRVSILNLTKILQEGQTHRGRVSCNITFGLSYFGINGLSLSKIRARALTTNLKDAQNELLLLYEEADDELCFKFWYENKKFDHSLIQNMSENFKILLTYITKNPDQLISQIPLLTPDEEKKILIDWVSSKEYSADKTISQLFEEQAERTPENIALTFENQNITYRELNEKANQLAHYLRKKYQIQYKQPLSPDTLIAITIERGPEMMIGILGVLKAGAAYVPIDPQYPAQRIQNTLEDSQAKFLLTQSSLITHLQPMLESLKSIPVIIQLDADWTAINQESKDNLPAAAQPKNLAYVIYTSGSTGTPKGVLIEHHNVIRLFRATDGFFHFNDRDTWTLFHSFAFDFSVWEIWGALLYGGKLVIVPYWIARSTEDFYDLLIKEKVTVLNQTPSAFKQLIYVDVKKGHQNLSLRYIIFGGEALEFHILEPWFKVHNDDQPKLINMYGITETTVHVTYYPITKNMVDIKASIIGKAISDLKLYVLDKSLQPLPIGVVGELYIGGAGIARGYLNRPDLNQERFITNPFSKDGSRLYKTGDLVRWLPDGNLEYIERADDQVKMRGFRIELGEIEAQLLKHPQVRQCVVLAKTENEEKRLVAYIVPKENISSINLSDIREFLKEKLPDYMVPSAFAVIDALPLTPSGKIDKKALAEKEVAFLKAEAVYAPPKSEKEKILAKIWSDILKQDLTTLGVHDNFFELGGDSILSLQIIARARQAGLQLTPQQLFAAPTIAGLADIAQQRAAEEIDQGIVLGEVPLTPIQHWFFERITPDYSFFNQSILCQMEGEVNLQYLQKSLVTLFYHHDSLRLRYTQQNNFWLQKYAKPDDHSKLFLFESYDFSKLTEEEQKEKIEKQTLHCHQQMNLALGPLVAACHYTSSHNKHRLLLIAHHLIIDGVSWRILLEDLENTYQQLVEGINEKELYLPSKTNSYKTWSAQLQHYAQTDIAKAEYDYWLLQTESAKKNIAGFDDRIYVDFPEKLKDFVNNNIAARYIEVNATLSIEETRALLFKVPSAYRTQINDSLLTALVFTFLDYFELSSLLINLEGHGREAVVEKLDISRTVGWFTSIFPVNLSLEKTEIDNIGKSLRVIKEQIRHIPHKGIGYGILKYLCKDQQITEALHNQPKPAVAFNYLGQLDGSEKKALIRPGPIILSQSPQMPGEHLLEINGWISENQLQFIWSFSKQFYHESSIQTLAESFIKNLRNIINHCIEQKQSIYSPSDFPLIRLSLDEFDQMIAEDLKDWKLENIQSLYPLTPLQKGLLFHELYDPKAHRYFVPLHLYLRGDLNIPLLQQACQSLIDHYDVLRTGFVGAELEEPLQFVIKNATAPWKVLDFRNLSAKEQQQSIQDFLEKDIQQGFILSNPPLIRFTLIRISDNDHILAWHNHHIILDGWSFAILLENLLTRYRQLNTGQAIASSFIQPFYNFIAWLQNQDLKAAQHYWQPLLQGFSSTTYISIRSSTDKKGQQQKTYDCDPDLTSLIQNFTRENHITISTLLHGVWAYLLHSYSNEMDVVFGSITSGRSANLEGIEKMVGLLINTLPVRSQLQPNQSILEYLKELQDQLFNSHRYDYAALTQIQSWSEMTADMPLFNTLLVFENYPMGSLKIGSKNSEQPSLLKLENYEHSHYEMSIAIMLIKNLSIRVDYNSSLYTEESINNLLRHFVAILKVFVENPGQTLKEISLLSPEENQKLLVDWIETHAAYPQNKTISQLFEEQVERTPNNIAASFEGRSLTFRELNHKANQLAHYLREQYEIYYGESLQPDTLIAISIERSLEMIIAILGVLKAGAAYVPIDPSYPKLRIEYMLQDSQAKILLTQSSLISNLQSILTNVESPPICVELDSNWPNIANNLEENLNISIAAENLAYVIYTSGSTGTPKGVMVKHVGVINLLQDFQTRKALSSDDQAGLWSSISFDVSVYEIWSALLYGCTLHIFSDSLRLDPNKLFPYIIKNHLNALYLPPYFLSELNKRVLENEDSFALKRLLVGTEPISEDLLIEIQRKIPGLKIINGYGPTETTICSTLYDISEKKSTRPNAPIGRPVQNTKLYILNNFLQLVPIGVVAELFIGGLGVTKGYLNNTHLTQQKFISNPFDPNSSSKLYRITIICQN